MRKLYRSLLTCVWINSEPGQGLAASPGVILALRSSLRPRHAGKLCITIPLLTSVAEQPCPMLQIRVPDPNFTLICRR
jgi:hypothetical protein